jgi:hypothetical protein
LPAWFRRISCLTYLLLRPWTWRRQPSLKCRLKLLILELFLYEQRMRMSPRSFGFV